MLFYQRSTREKSKWLEIIIHNFFVKKKQTAILHLSSVLIILEWFQSEKGSAVAKLSGTSSPSSRGSIGSFCQVWFSAVGTFLFVQPQWFSLLTLTASFFKYAFQTNHSCRCHSSCSTEQDLWEGRWPWETFNREKEKAFFELDVVTVVQHQWAFHRTDTKHLLTWKNVWVIIVSA